MNAKSKLVLTVGPSPDLVGGMSSVINQMTRLDFAGRYAIECFPITLSSSSEESSAHRIARHVSQRLRLGRILRERDFAIVHIHTCSGFSFHRCAWDLRVARRHGAKTVLHMHGAQFDNYVDRASGLEKRLIRHALQSADRVVALSARWHQVLLSAAPKARIEIIENAVDPAPAQRQRPCNGPCRFLTLARMDAWKGIDDLLDAASLMQRRGMDFRLTLAGPEGSAGDRRQIQGKIDARDLTSRVVYVGTVMGAEKEHLLEATDVYVQPSHHEGMPISILEALAHEVPVVATRVGAIPEIIDDDVHGLIVPARDPGALAQAMGTLVVDVPRRLALGSAGLTLAKSRFSLARFREELTSIYDTLLSQGSRSSLTQRIAQSAAVL